MKIEALKPNIVRIAIHQEQDDPHYGSCLWGYYDFDLDRYMLSIQSDCGNAAYRWCETPDSESFLHLMARIDDDYLMHKLFMAEEVDVSSTVARMREWLGISEDEEYQNDSLTDEEREEREEALEELERLLNDAPQSYGTAERTLFDWNDDHNFDIDCIYECVMTDFTAWQKRIVEIFRDYVQPKIREIIKEEADHGRRFLEHLEKCPVCGKTPHLLKISSGEYGSSYKVNCDISCACKGNGFECGDWFHMLAMAGKDWNDRARRDKLDDAGRKLYDSLWKYRKVLTRQQMRTLKGQIMARDTEGARRALERLTKAKRGT